MFLNTSIVAALPSYGVVSVPVKGSIAWMTHPSVTRRNDQHEPMADKESLATAERVLSPTYVLFALHIFRMLLFSKDFVQNRNNGFSVPRPLGLQSNVKILYQALH